ncbi:hypothetical protein [Sphingobium sp. ZW T5_29]|uniref:hypothetical protein n=1 Tax=Sphingobium sp. ZW T5_29 TaxID=3378077 RepID=UPI0038527B8D
MAESVFPWKRGYLKVPPKVVASLGKIEGRLVQVAATKRVHRQDIEAGIYAHVGLIIDAAGNVTAKQGNLPRIDAGKWSARNAFGWEIVRDDLPMTTKSYSFEAPNFGDAARNGTSMRVIQREVYQRQVFEPRGLLIDTNVMDDRGDIIVVQFALNELLDRDHTEFDRLFLWSLNVLQENTGVTDVYSSNATREDFLGSILLAWEVFPPGSVDEVIARLAKSPPYAANAPDFEKHVRDRVALFEQLKPTSYLRGQGGFGSYFGAQFADDLVVFENLRYGNAIYVLYENWEDVSKRSRLDLLRDNDAQFDRIPHVADWQDRLRALVRFQLQKRRRRR